MSHFPLIIRESKNAGNSDKDFGLRLITHDEIPLNEPFVVLETNASEALLASIIKAYHTGYSLGVSEWRD